ncbi:acylphosphatase [Arthrobacter sp. Sa2CUA1]|uniref:acylphosphatase n=1 Tax=Arthrobacter gallicola TaxID=2762225 RepID=A0ABR8UTW1_9MICC|nr:acylphosphatase [Arthrobacter gallicola]MBD7996010.1 acylphosphatase [Arthrobacter gallicola]
MDSGQSTQEPGNSIRVTAAVNGMVQGVGFRYWVMRRALNLGLTGTVINRADGSVLITAEGLPSAVDGLLEQVRSPSAPGAVHDVEEHRSAATGEFEGFAAG